MRASVQRVSPTSPTHRGTFAAPPQLPPLAGGFTPLIEEPEPAYELMPAAGTSVVDYGQPLGSGVPELESMTEGSSASSPHYVSSGDESGDAAVVAGLAGLVMTSAVGPGQGGPPDYYSAAAGGGQPHDELAHLVSPLSAVPGRPAFFSEALSSGNKPAMVGMTPISPNQTDGKFGE